MPRCGVVKFQQQISSASSWLDLEAKFLGLALNVYFFYSRILILRYCALLCFFFYFKNINALVFGTSCWFYWGSSTIFFLSLGALAICLVLHIASFRCHFSHDCICLSRWMVLDSQIVYMFFVSCSVLWQMSEKKLSAFLFLLCLPVFHVLFVSWQINLIWFDMICVMVTEACIKSCCGVEKSERVLKMLYATSLCLQFPLFALAGL